MYFTLYAALFSTTSQWKTCLVRLLKRANHGRSFNSSICYLNSPIIFMIIYDCVHGKTPSVKKNSGEKWKWMTGTKHYKGLCPNNTELLQHSDSKIYRPCFHKNQPQRTSQIHERAETAKPLITDTNAKMWKRWVMIIKLGHVGARRWTSTFALTRKITWPEYHQTTVYSFVERLILSSNISEAGRCFIDNIQLKTIQKLWSILR